MFELKLEKSGKNKENRKKCTFLTLFYTRSIPKLIEKLKNAKIYNFRSYFIPSGQNNQQF